MKSSFPNFFFFIDEIASASPIANCIVVLEVGTIPYPDSNTFGINKLILDDLNKIESLFDTIPIRVILFFFEYEIIFESSEVLPELLIKIRTSFFVIST